MKKLKWLLGLLFCAILPTLQSCDDDEGYSIGDFSWDWATVRTTGGGAYYLEGDRWGLIEPVASAVFSFKPVEGERVIALFNPLYDTEKGVQVKMERVRNVLTKEVEEMKTEEEAAAFGNDPIVIYQGDMWLGGKYLNVIFQQNVPASKKHRISLVQSLMNPKSATPGEEHSPVAEDGYVHLELRYNTYGDVTGYWANGCVSFNLEEFYPTAKNAAATPMKGFKITIHSKENGEGRVVVLDWEHPVGVPEKAHAVSASSFIR